MIERLRQSCQKISETLQPKLDQVKEYLDQLDPKEFALYFNEILVHKESHVLFPRADVGKHLSYEKPRKGAKRLVFHLERNMKKPDRTGLSKPEIFELYAEAERDFSLLYEELMTNPELADIEELVGYTNFMSITGVKYGFDSKVIIDDPLLCWIFDLRFEKPNLTGMETPETIKEFSATLEAFGARFGPEGTPRFARHLPKEEVVTD